MLSYLPFQVTKKLGLSYTNAKDLNNLMDQLPGWPPFHHKEIVIGGEACEFYYCDVNECVHALFHDPEFTPHLKFSPEQHYADADHTEHAFHDMHTGCWWWQVQVQCGAKLFAKARYG